MLYENLPSFCDQDYPQFEIRLIVDDRVHGHNRQVSNLANMSAAAKYGLLVVADSDIRVDHGCLTTVTAPLSDPGVRVVTCLYVGRPTSGVWSALEAMFINEWCLPSVLVARALPAAPLCSDPPWPSGAKYWTASVASLCWPASLADDYVLGQRVAARGLRIVLSPNVVDAVVTESSFRSLWWRELRWARTIRTIQPLGYALSFVRHHATTIPRRVSVGMRRHAGDARTRADRDPDVDKRGVAPEELSRGERPDRESARDGVQIADEHRGHHRVSSLPARRRPPPFTTIAWPLQRTVRPQKLEAHTTKESKSRTGAAQARPAEALSAPYATRWAQTRSPTAAARMSQPSGRDGETNRFRSARGTA